MGYLAEITTESNHLFVTFQDKDGKLQEFDITAQAGVGNEDLLIQGSIYVGWTYKSSRYGLPGSTNPNPIIPAIAGSGCLLSVLPILRLFV